jgi:hypothetical protein
VRYANDFMTLTIDSDGAALRLDVLIKPEIRAAAKIEPPTDVAPADIGQLPGADEYSGGLKGARGFFTRDESGAVVGIDLAGRLFSRVRTVRRAVK